LLSIGIGHDVTRYYQKAVKITDVNDLAETLVDKMIEMLA
jgi:cobaltochelatase CobT